MSTIVVVLLGLFLACNGIWLAAMISASRADRVVMDLPNLVDTSADRLAGQTQHSKLQKINSRT